MNFKKTLQILSKDIEEIEKILEEIDISSPASRIEMKLATSKLKNLRENFGMFGELLEEIPATPPPPPAPAPSPAPEEEPSQPPQPVAVEPAAEETTPVPSPEETPKKEPGEKPLAEKKTEIPAAEEKASGRHVEEETEEVTPEKNGKGKKVLLSDTLQSRQGYRNEQLGREHNGEDLSSHLSKSAVTDLRKIINLNEKFMFIRDLFDGDKQRYEETIRFINKTTSRKKAEEFLEGFKWNTKSEAARRFYELVQRKLKSLDDA